MNQVQAEENRLQIEQLNCQLNLCNLETIESCFKVRQRLFIELLRLQCRLPKKGVVSGNDS